MILVLNSSLYSSSREIKNKVSLALCFSWNVIKYFSCLLPLILLKFKVKINLFVAPRTKI